MQLFPTGKFFLGLFSAVLLPSTLLLGQANVPENLEKTYVYVDGIHGSDSNAGNQANPVKTLNKGISLALSNNSKNVATKVMILPATYRESVSLWPKRYQTSAPITLQAQTPGTAVISGADVWSGWQASSSKQIFTHEWPYTWGYCALAAPTEQDIVRRREMILVNGKNMTQLLALNQLQPGSFYVNENAHMVYLWPPAGTSMASATVEVAVRPTLFEMHSKTNWVLRGLTFQAANSCRAEQSAVYITGWSDNILLDSDKFLWNNAMGLDLNSVKNTTVSNSVADHNGESGMVGYEVKYGLWEGNDTSYNNWRGAQGALYDWTSNGSKFLRNHNDTFHALRATYNEAKGLHWDTDNMDVTADSLALSMNLLSGVQVEVTQGPMSISNSYICNNNLLHRPYDGGIAINSATYLTLSGNNLYHNGTGQFMVDGITGGRSVTNYETGVTTTLINHRITFDQNTFEGDADPVFQDGYLTIDWSLFNSTFASDYNTWRHNLNQPFTAPVPKGYTTLTFAGWQSLTGKDQHSQSLGLATSQPTECAAAADAANYWLALFPKPTVSGSKISNTLMVIPIGGFSGAVSLKVYGSISGATISLSPTSTINSGSATVTVSAASTPAGTYPLTVVANSGNLTKSVTFNVVVP